MKYVSLLAAGDIYSCSSSLKIKQWSVDHELLGSLCVELSRFVTLLGAESEDAYWHPFILTLKHYCFELSAAPLPLNHWTVRDSGVVERLERHVAKCEMVFPQLAVKAHDLLDRFRELNKSVENPLIVPIIDILDNCEGSTTAVAVARANLIPHVQRAVRESIPLRRLDVISVSELRGEACYSRLIFVGAACWFPEHVFTSPRAPDIDVVKYAWLPNRWRREPLFLGSSAVKEETDFGKRLQEDLSDEHAPSGKRILSEAVVDPYDLMPRVNWEQVKRGAASQSQGIDPRIAGEDAELVEAVPFLLEGGMAVLLDATEGARVTVIDLDRGPEGQVLRLPIAQVEPDMFILLRTEGGGEYIVEVADQILGGEAARARELQRRWKSMLRAAVVRSSPKQAVSELASLGSPRASEANLRNWMSYRSIKTDDYRDFEAMMRFLGLADQSAECWGLMTMIDSAHHRAGQSIRRLLMNQVLRSNITELRKHGRMDFQLTGAGAACLTAFRVKESHEGSIEVPVYRLGRPFDVEGTPWLV
jgi:hypothetical protein